MRRSPAGRPLRHDVADRLGSALGADLGGVRIHDDAHADRLSRDLGAQAFTSGHDIWFRRGAYAPGARGGLELLAHEAVHAVQQATGRVSTPAGSAGPGGVRISAPDDRYERQAHRIAAHVARAADGPAGTTVDLPTATGPTMTGPAVVQRWVNEDFGLYKPRGLPTDKQLKRSRTFAGKVSDFAEQARTELLTGQHDDWGKAGHYNAKGARWLAFIGLLQQGKSLAATHAGNVIEERVYQLMAQSEMVLVWDSQAAAGASRPDIVVTLGESAKAIVDITSDVAHVVNKAGIWSDDDIVYVAEAVFDSVTFSILAKAKTAILGGEEIDEDELQAMEDEVAEQKQEAYQAKRDLYRERAAEVDAYGTVEAFAQAEFGNDIRAASAYLHEAGVKRYGMKVKKRKVGDTGTVLRRIEKKKESSKEQRKLKKKRQEAVKKAYEKEKREKRERRKTR